ncbi:MAG: NAD(P)-dependent oxidoreductase [Candidatus Micrarchaeota archaeon]|nr:NAD(P)-dependent oxidoreductase [Candidatus Micrarchaeota archaeon]
MEKLLLTGSNGFIGSNLRRRLDGYKVHELSSNLTNYKAAASEIKRFAPNYVVHLGAITHHKSYYEHYIDTLKTNLLGTVNIVEACRSVSNFKQFIYPSSVWVYAPSRKKLTETSAVRPMSSHGVSKIACDYYIEYLGTAYNFPYTIFRLSNVYGREKGDQFIESTISQMLKTDLVKLGNPNVVRDWIYIEDIIDAFVKALGNGKALKETMLLGTGVGYSTRQVADIIARVTKFKGKIKWNTNGRVVDAEKTVCDNSKARRILKWKPDYTLEEGLKKMIR